MTLVEFSQNLSEIANISQDSTLELILSISSVAGVETRLSDTEVEFCLYLDGDSYPFISISSEDHFPKVRCSDIGLKRFLYHHGHFPFEADEFVGYAELHSTHTDVESIYIDFCEAVNDHYRLATAISGMLSDIQYKDPV